MIHWFYLFSNQGSFTLSMAFLESPRKVINTNFKKRGRDKNLVNTVLSTYAYTHTVFSSQVRFEQNIHVLDKWPLDLRIFLKTGNNRRAVLENRLMQLTNIVWFIMKHRYMWSFSSLDSTLIITEPNSLQITIGTNYGRNGQNRCP